MGDAARLLAAERRDVPVAIYERRYFRQYVLRAAVLLGRLRVSRVLHVRGRGVWRRPRAPASDGGVQLAMTLVAYLFVLGRATPVYHVAYLLIPGISMFRFPTRFLVVVELGLSVLAAVGTCKDSQRTAGARPDVGPERLARGVRRVRGDRGRSLLASAAPESDGAGNGVARAPGNRGRRACRQRAAAHLHAAPSRSAPPTFQLAHGWADVRPYFDVRDVLEPNTGGGFWETPSGDCYAGVSARWFVDVWGDHNRENSFLSPLSDLDFEQQRLRVHPALVNILRAYGVTHILSPFPEAERTPRARSAGAARVRLSRSRGRARARIRALGIRRRDRRRCGAPHARSFVRSEPRDPARRCSRVAADDGYDRPRSRRRRTSVDHAGGPTASRDRRHGAVRRLPVARRHVLSGMDRNGRRRAHADLPREREHTWNRAPRKDGTTSDSSTIRRASCAARGSAR